MNSNFDIKDEKEKTWISITGYRALLILRILLNESCSSKELIEKLRKNPILAKSTSKDTIMTSINSLKAAGCIFTRPTKANNYQYKLLSHPFILNLTPEEIDKLIVIRENIAKELNLKEIFDMNGLYEKISDLTFNDEYKSKIENSKPLKFISNELFSIISNPNIINKKLLITYNSPKFGREEFEIVPQKIIYENQKAYIWCYNCKYESLGLINIERIFEIKEISSNDNFEAPKIYEVIYEIFGDSINDFELQEYEEIISETEDKITVKAFVNNEFLFIQRILLFGTSFKIILPAFFKEVLINKIKLIQKGYEQ